MKLVQFSIVVSGSLNVVEQPVRGHQHCLVREVILALEPRYYTPAAIIR